MKHYQDADLSTEKELQRIPSQTTPSEKAAQNFDTRQDVRLETRIRPVVEQKKDLFIDDLDKDIQRTEDQLREMNERFKQITQTTPSPLRQKLKDQAKSPLRKSANNPYSVSLIPDDPKSFHID